MSEKPQKEEKKPLYKWAEMQQVKFCPHCGKAAIAQDPAEQEKNIITCGACGVRFKLAIIPY